MDVAKYNRWAWDQLVEKGNRWTRPVSAESIASAREGCWDILLTPTRNVPREWLGDVKGQQILCLAGGGGQQAPILAAAGAEVTTLDNSQRQLDQDQLVARREGLTIKSCLGEMNDLSMLDDESFDAVVHPCSNSFVADVRSVWCEAHRVLRTGGILLSGFTNPLMFIFDYEAMEQGKLNVAYRIPYSDTESLTEEQRQKLRDECEPLIFGHSLDDQIGGQLDAGFKLDGFYEDRSTDGPQGLLCDFIAAYVATRALKA